MIHFIIGEWETMSAINTENSNFQFCGTGRNVSWFNLKRASNLAQIHILGDRERKTLMVRESSTKVVNIVKQNYQERPGGQRLEFY